MTRRTARLATICLLVLALISGSWAAWGQYQSKTGNVVGAVGGACDSSSITYGWPDTNGDILKCVSNVWTLVTQPATAAGSTGQVQFNSSNALAASANLFWDNTNFWLGIGTSTPSAPLQVYDYNNPTTNSTIAVLSKNLTTAYDGGSLDFTFLWYGSTPYTPARIMALDQFGYGGQLAFYTKAADGNSAGAAVERVRIAHNGNVGIGQTAPAATLDVAGTVDVEGNGVASEIANASSTGTTVNKLAKLTGAPSTAVKAGTSDTGGIIGIVVGGAGTTGNAQIAVSGQATCVFDGATTAGDYVGISSTTAGDCHDAGATYPTSGQVLGRVLSTNGSSGFYVVALYGPEIKGPSSSASAAGSDTQVQYNKSNSFAGDSGLVYDYTHTRLGIGSATPAATLDIVGNLSATVTNTATSGSIDENYINTLFVPASTSTAGINGLHVNFIAGGSADLSGDYVDGIINTLLVSDSNSAVALSAFAATNNVNISSATNYPTGAMDSVDNWSNATDDLVTGVEGQVGNHGTSTITFANGVSGFVTNYDAGGTIDSARGVSAGVGLVAGTIDYGYGVYIDTIQATNKWGLYQTDATASNYFAGSVGIGTNTPLHLLHVNGIEELGLAGGTIGKLLIDGNTSGTITIQPQAVAGTYNFNLPTSAGSSGQPLLSGGGGSTAMSFGTLGVAAGGTGLATLTSNVIYKGNGSSALATSALTDNGTIVSSSESVDVTSKAVLMEIANEGSTGTTQNKLVKLTGAPSTAIISTAGDTGGAVGIVTSASSTAGNAQIAVSGQANCVFDNTTVAGDYVQISSGTAGDCHDAGSTLPTSGQVIGRVLASGSAGTYAVELQAELQGTSAGGSGTVSSGTQYQMAYYASGGTTISGDSNIVTDSSNNLQVKGGNISIGTTAVTNAVDIAGQAAKTIGMEREYTSSTAGNNLTITAGGAVSGGTNLAGGTLVVSSGTSTGTGTSSVQIQTYPAGSTGTSDATALTALTVSATGATGSTAATTVQGNAGSGTDKAGGTLTLASGISTGTGTSGMNFKVYGAGSTGSTANSATTAMTILSTGLVGIGTTSPAYLLHVGSASASGIVAELQNSSGACTYQPGASYESVSCSSDARLKKDIADTGDMLAWVRDMRIRDFTIIADGERRTGVIAQELLPSHPDMVRMGPNGFYTVDQPDPWKLVKAIQQLKRLTDTTLAAVIAGLKDFGISIEQGQTRIDHLILGSQKHPTGLTIYDRADGSPHCVSFYADSMVTSKGACPN